MTDGNKTGLVLEGGGMRGAFTTGVLDFFLDSLDKEFSFIPVWVFQQEPSMHAAFCQNKKAGALRQI